MLMFSCKNSGIPTASELKSLEEAEKICNARQASLDIEAYNSGAKTPGKSSDPKDYCIPSSSLVKLPLKVRAPFSKFCANLDQHTDFVKIYNDHRKDSNLEPDKKYCTDSGKDIDF